MSKTLDCSWKRETNKNSNGEFIKWQKEKILRELEWLIIMEYKNDKPTNDKKIVLPSVCFVVHFIMLLISQTI
jgi:hypothetical protein